MTHRAPWDQRDEATLYRCIAAGMMHEQIAERLGRTRRAITWKVNRDREKRGTLFPRFVKGAVIRASAAAMSKGVEVEGARIPSTLNSGKTGPGNGTNILFVSHRGRPVAAAGDLETPVHSPV